MTTLDRSYQLIKKPVITEKASDETVRRNAYTFRVPCDARKIEIRKEAGEDYDPIKGFLRQYELMYVVADERDMIQLCSVYRDEDVYMYRVKATREQARAMFVDMLQRANKLIDDPEFYNTLTNNCTNNIQRHVNRITPGRVPYQLGVLLPGLSDRLAYNLGLIDTDLPFEQAKERANISELARRYKDSPDFSLMIRR